MNTNLIHLSSEEKRELLRKKLQKKEHELSDDSCAPLSSQQQGLLFISKLYPDHTQYHMPYVLQLLGTLDLDALEKSINEIIRRHATLRTVFVTNQFGVEEQQILPFTPMKLPFLNCSLEENTREEIIPRIVESEYSRKFDLSKGPLARFNLVKFAEEEYVLIFLVHHIVFDGVSMDKFLEEMRQHYEMFVNSEDSLLPELSYTYTAFARDSHSFSKKTEIDKQLEFWKSRLSGDLPILDLPIDNKRPLIVSGKGATLEFPIPDDVMHSIRRFGQLQGATLFMSLLSTFYILLHRYTQQEDILVGTPVSCRDSSELMPLIGLLINSVVLRADLSGDPTFTEVLQRVKNVALDAFSNQEVSFSEVVRAVKPDRSHGRSPLFQVMFTTEHSSDKDWVMAGVKGKLMMEHQGTSKYDMTFVVRESLKGASIVIEYSTDLFNKETIKRMATHYVELLREAAKRPNISFSRFNILPDEEREKLLLWNKTEVPISKTHTVLHCFEQIAQEIPFQIAAVDQYSSITYRELNKAADLLAHRLRLLQESAGGVIAICMNRSISILVAMLGVWKAGAAYLPLDPGHPPDRLEYMLKDARVAVVITEDELKERLPVSSKVLCLGELLKSENVTSEMVSLENPVNELGYVIYTSGSTGTPKGVGVTHSNLMNLIDWHIKTYSLSQEDRTSQLAGVSFDAAVWEIWPTLLVGGTIYLADEETRLSPQRLQQWLIENHINISFVPTPLAEVLLTFTWPKSTHLRAMLTGGDKLHRFPDISLPFQLVNHYGPTETTVVATYGVVPKGIHDGSPVIGRPIANTHVYILDANQQKMPIGVPGELYIGGLGVSQGYIFRSDLMENNFVEVEVHSGQWERLYRTGDIARILADGNIEYLSRKDNQVKIRGLRIELGEIETLLAAHSGVKEAVVVTRGTLPGESKIIAYVTVDQQLEIKEPELIRALKKKLPDYMVPVRIICMTKFPVTRNGKVDRLALPEVLDYASSHEFMAPQNKLEKYIADVWMQVLGKEKISSTDNFFDIGGHSLLLARVHELLQKGMNTNIQLIELFQYTTVQQIAQRLTSEHALESSISIHSGQEQKGINDSNASPGNDDQKLIKEDIAVIGLACRVPGAQEAEQFWNNLKDGIDSIRWFSEAELIEAGADVSNVSRTNYVAARGYLEGADQFDAGFFHVSPREAEVMDPQHRIFLENTWEALEHAGYDPVRFEGKIGIYAGTAFNTYLLNNLLPNRQYVDMVGMYSIFMNNDKDSLATRTAYKLNLRGPAVTIQTACSTSLVAIHMACQGLFMNDCEIALAGGVTVRSPLMDGYLYREGEISSPVGQCRTFDDEALGTIGGMGSGVVVLKRLSQALKDGDTIYSVIKGSAINNDGSKKIGFTAPSVEGQANVISEALHRAQVSPESISYIEAHGTGTPLGDPIEVSALSKAFRNNGAQKNEYCALGSVKSNIGHLDAAAGVIGFIKTVLSLKNRQLPPTLHFKTPNHKIDFTHSPFYVNSNLQNWNGPVPLRAGVSALGVGGTNAHVILEQAPFTKGSTSIMAQHLIILSARTFKALENMSFRLAQWLEGKTNEELANAAYTLQVGRSEFPCRRVLLTSDINNAVEQLRNYSNGGEQPKEVKTSPSVIFTLSGQYAQNQHYVNELYKSEPLFTKEVDKCCKLTESWLEYDIKKLWFASDIENRSTSKIHNKVLDLAIFIENYALGKFWLDLGIHPEFMIAQGIGEYVAACLVGVLDLRDALEMVAKRSDMHTEEHSPYYKTYQNLMKTELKTPIFSVDLGRWIGKNTSAPDYWDRFSNETQDSVLSLKEIEGLFNSPNHLFLEIGSNQSLLTTLPKVHLQGYNPQIIGIHSSNAGERETIISRILSVLGELWLSGVTVLWSQLNLEGERRRIALPSYPFEHQRFWIDIVKEHKPIEKDILEEVAAAKYSSPEPEGEVDLQLKIQEIVIKVWKEVVGSTTIQTEDDFFEIGGDSLMASRVISRIKEIFPIELPLGTLFTFSQLRDFAHQIEERVVAKISEMQE
ncbi:MULTISPECIES: non-ribosomal peptide synthetase [Paenibacillus]|uniref:non-ribosomal peptide synthetase n=1 Tax=Paenibacillus TaxID=44249 RepID=UPI00096D3A5D|nr:non-ribosomal peptide synthetase [Paenibacillus odorifer]OMD74247.1 hypothetical protein BSK53_30340 [Paenibacillus odorifer]